MNITSITYERRLSDGDYGNTMVSMTAEPTEHDDPADVLDRLRDLVELEVRIYGNRQRSTEAKREQSDELDYTIRDKTRRIEQQERHLAALQRILQAHGATIPEHELAELDDIPF